MTKSDNKKYANCRSRDDNAKTYTNKGNWGEPHTSMFNRDFFSIYVPYIVPYIFCSNLVLYKILQQRNRACAADKHDIDNGPPARRPYRSPSNQWKLQRRRERVRDKA